MPRLDDPEISHEVLYETQQAQRLTDIMNAACDIMIRNAAQRFYTQQIQEEKNNIPKVLELAVAKFGRECFVKPKKEKNKKWFITISAKDHIDPVKFFSQMQQCIKKKQLQGQGEYVLEQRSQGDETPYGWHIHWRVELDEYISFGVVKQQVYQCFTSYLAGDNYVDIKFQNSNQADYIRGKKSSPAKQIKVDKDIILRNKYKIPHIIVY